MIKLTFEALQGLILEQLLLMLVLLWHHFCSSGLPLGYRFAPFGTLWVPVRFQFDHLGIKFLTFGIRWVVFSFLGALSVPVCQHRD